MGSEWVLSEWDLSEWDLSGTRQSLIAWKLELSGDVLWGALGIHVSCGVTKP
jgi:hypothetical protein